MFANLEKVMGGTAEKLSNNKVLIAIRDGFLVTTPLIIVASFFILAGNFPIEGYTDFMAQFFGQGWENHMDAVIDSTFSVIALLGLSGLVMPMPVNWNQTLLQGLQSQSSAS